MKPRIVIAGFGDAGLLTAAHLSKRYDITAVTTKSGALVSGQELGARLTQPDMWKGFYLLPYERVKHLAEVNILHGKATALRPQGNELIAETAAGEEVLPYDILVIASGTNNGFWRTDAVKTAIEVEAEMAAQSAKALAARRVAIIGAGPTGVSAASHIKEHNPGADVHIFLRGAEILPRYHPKARAFVSRRLADQGVQVHRGHSVILPPPAQMRDLAAGKVSFLSGQPPFDADLVLWAAGQLEPNNGFIPKDMLDGSGYVMVDEKLRAAGHDNIFAIGDIAASDENRSSARNAAYSLLAKNIAKTLSGRADKMKAFKAPKHRWGSILGIQNEGLRIFTPAGGNVKIGRWGVKNILFPVFVHKMIYRGFNKDP